MELRLAGVSQEDAAEKLGLTLNTVRVMECQAKKRVLVGFIPYGGKRGSPVCRRGHAKPPGGSCKECKAEYQAEWYARKANPPPEGQAEWEKRHDEARETNRRLLAKGRCQHPMRSGRPCGLLLPCWDHDAGR
jgi:hypothetical protein